MDHAWLDELSEDWVSEHPSSGSPAPSLPSLGNSISSNNRAASSRIPKYNPQKQSWTAPGDGPSSPLNERSPNQFNVPLSQRGEPQPSKLREVSTGSRGRQLSRTLSASSMQSTQFHTVQLKSHSLSPVKDRPETPEWKRRLLHGDVAYGEQRDLFCAAGLETLFQPPPEAAKTSNQIPKQAFGIRENSIVMPSSPPMYNYHPSDATCQEHEENNLDNDAQERRAPRAINYRLADLDGSEFSTNDLSRGSSFQLNSRSTREQEDTEFPADPASAIESSMIHNEPAMNGTGRTASGQSDIRNEALSPIFIAKHNTIDGKVDYTTSSTPAEELKQRLEHIQEEDVDENGGSRKDSTGDCLAETTIGTEDFVQNNKFVNFRRGGYSQEGSFQKRMLSPSSLPAVDESAMLPEESMQASTPKQLPNIRKTRASHEYQTAPIPQDSEIAPKTPCTSPKKGSEKAQQGSSGSPLKLFGTYDTFTNQKLLRRLSQFQGDLDEQNGPTNTQNDESFQTRSRPITPRDSPSLPKLNNFGGGELDGFQFSEDMSYNSSKFDSQDEDKENVALPLLNPESQSIFRFQLEPSPALEDGFTATRRTKHTTTTSTSKHIINVRRTRAGSSSSDLSAALHPSQRQENLQTPRKRNGDSEGKRLQRTPLRDPTPKRRRTLQKADSDLDEEEESVAIDSLKDTHHQMQSIIGRKRKDALHGNDQQAANPKVLAMRQILRPRTPTPNQRNSQNERQPLAELDPFTEQARLLQEEKLAKIQAELDSTNPLKLSGMLGMSQQMQNDSRKGSVTTQDFLDEAKKIMAGIRDKVRPRSGLASLEESESETDRVATPGIEHEEDFEDSYQESTKEPFSRPPSREGQPVQRLPIKQEDPALLDHLRKYQEMSEMDGIMASSIKSLALVKEMSNVAKELDRMTDETISRTSGRSLQQGAATESDPPNMRISKNPDSYRKRKHSTSSIPSAKNEAEAEYPSHGSNSSSGQSTSRSIPTGSSRESDTRRVINPQSVSHLIPQQVAGMIFDRERNIWIKRKSVSAESKDRNFLPSDDTEDDPFGDIPDLSVDETQERQRIKAVNAKRQEEARMAQENRDEQQQNAAGRQHELEDRITPEDADSAEHSKLTHTGSSTATMGMASPMTTWSNGDNHSTCGSSQSKNNNIEKQRTSRRIETRGEIFEEVIEEVEKEISILEDRVQSESPRRRRNVTITFSSPVASVIQPNAYEDEASMQPETAEADESEDDAGNESVIVTKNRSQKISTPMRSAMRHVSRIQSLGGHTFSMRPVSRIDERDEESTIRNNEAQDQSSISIVVSAPAHKKREASLILATPRPAHDVGTLTLTPLSDFTVHHGDQSLGLDVSYVAQNQRYVLGIEQKRTLSHSIKQLVEKLSEVEPYEPFWGNLKKLELNNRGLTNLHKLNEFCGQLEDLEVSQNQLSQLDGIPQTVRQLHITHNSLTELTAWGHLSNLQYIDVSNNELESLSSFRSLVHLRTLTADNNHITSLDGVHQLDGLLSLRLRGNSIQSCNFGGTKLLRLTNLDLAENQISEIRNLYELRSLSELNLENNFLAEFPADSREETLWSLSSLRLSGNALKSLDITQFPNLRQLFLDRDNLGNVTGLCRSKYLDSLSMREQKDGSSLNMAFINDVCEVRKLFLSGNFLKSFSPQVEFLNLQYLELANCGLEALPDNFASLFANARTINLNFNALKDLKPLVGIRRLRKLHLAGNRIMRLRTTARVLGHFPSLTVVDLRGNPLTVGFYPPMAETRLVLAGAAVDADPQDPFVLDRADRERDDKYMLRLDMKTRMMRRTLEILVLGDCPRLRTFDGLDVDMAVIIRQDSTWQALINAGVLRVPSIEASAPVDHAGEENVGIEATSAEKTVEESARGNVLNSKSPAEAMASSSTKKYTTEQKEKTIGRMTEGSASGSAGASKQGTAQRIVHLSPRGERWPAEDSFA